MYVKCDEKIIKFYRTLWEKSFTEVPKSAKEKTDPAIETVKNSLGWGHFARLYRDDNDQLIKNPANCDRPTVRTFQTLFNNTLVDDDVHWFVFNTLSTSVPVTKTKRDDKGKIISEKGGRREAMVRWINAIAIDIDIKFDNINELHNRIAAAKLPPATVINATTHGYHVYWILEERVPGTPKAKQLYKHIMKNMQLALNQEIEVMDGRAKDLVRYLQVPRQIIYDNYENRPTFSEFQIWMNTHGQETYKTNSHKKAKVTRAKKYNKKGQKEYGSTKEQYADFLIQNMMNNGVAGRDRNRATYVLASYYKVRGYSSERTQNILVAWNEKHGHTVVAQPHTNMEVIKTIQSVYDKERTFPYTWLEEITGVRIDRSLKNGRKRSNRVQSHYTERIKDMMYYLIENQIGLIYGSQRELAEMFGIPRSTFAEIVKFLQKGKFGRLVEVIVEGKGRNAKTIIRLNPAVFKKYDQRKLETFMDNIFKYDKDVDFTGLDKVVSYRRRSLRAIP